MMRARIRVAIAWVMFALAMPCALGAYEWRTAWASPYPLVATIWTLRANSNAKHVELSCAQPFGLPGVVFNSVAGSTRAWEFHAGTLRSPAYREWHAGAARRWRPMAGLSVLTGLRCFGIHAGGESLPPCVAMTAIADCAPFRDLPVALSAGVVDATWTHSHGQPSTLLTAGAVCGRRGRQLWIGRQTCSQGAAETLLGISLSAGGAELTHCFRIEVGEATVTLSVFQAGLVCSAGAACHPDLGWTPSASIGWTANDE